jgi:hypothetical protein
MTHGLHEPLEVQNLFLGHSNQHGHRTQDVESGNEESGKEQSPRNISAWFPDFLSHHRGAFEAAQ